MFAVVRTVFWISDSISNHWWHRPERPHNVPAV